MEWTKLLALYRKRSHDCFQKTLLSKDRWETLKKTSDFQPTKMPNLYSNSMNTRARLPQTTKKTVSWNKRWTLSSKRILISTRKSETPNKILDLVPTKWLNLTPSLMNTETESQLTIKSLRPIVRGFRNSYQKTPHLAKKYVTPKKTYVSQPDKWANSKMSSSCSAQKTNNSKEEFFSLKIISKKVEMKGMASFLF
jgi:hypothetical protein